MSLHVHERIDPRTIIEKTARTNQNVQSNITRWFETPENTLPLRNAIEFYKHDQGWANRLIAGDSLLVMNSLLEKEGMEGKVKMIYFDPPYGIDFGLNYQVRVGKTKVKDAITEEPESIKAFRDTWELGIHSYLTYLKDRLELAKKMLKDGGSLFLQISQNNMHHVREVLDEVFGPDNFYASIVYVKTSGKGGKDLDTINDYILWYTKGKIDEYRQLYIKRKASLDRYKYVEEVNGTRRKVTDNDIANLTKLKRYVLDNLTSQTPSPTTNFEFEFEKKTYSPGARGWRTNLEGMTALVKKNRLVGKSNTLWYVQYFDDFNYVALNNVWTDTLSSFAKSVYIVQTNIKAIERCMLMATKPGDLVFDPTCGSGTTAYVAEKHGRRWITCDTSRVATAVARQRLLTSVFEYYELANPALGVKGEFKCAQVPRVTLKTIAADKPPESVVLWDKPSALEKSRVSGPFTVEAVPSPTVTEAGPCNESNGQYHDLLHAHGSPSRHEKWCQELQNSGIRGRSNQKIRFTEVKQLQGTRWLHGDAETMETKPRRAVVSFGPEHAPLGRGQVAMAMEEAQRLVPVPKMVIFAAMQFDPEAAREIEGLEWPGVVVIKAEMNKDLLTGDLKKSKAGNEVFWLVGQPDISVVKEGEHYVVTVNGFDYYNAQTDEIESGDHKKIAMWELDTDYDGRSVYAQQVFFPMVGKIGDWEKLAKTLKSEIDLDLIAKYGGTTSIPFKAGSHKRIAVKIIDSRGVESLKVVEL